MFIERYKCVICENELIDLYTIENFPIRLSTEEIPIYEFSPLKYSKCSLCSTIQLKELIPLEYLYGKSHNYTSVGTTWNNFNEFIVNKLNQITDNKVVLEIGCPSGKIAKKIDNFKKWYIVEPNKNENITFDKNIVFIQKFFDENLQIDEEINIIFHSHLFEHIYNPNIFLKKCFEILVDDGIMFFAIPDMEYISKNNLCPFNGVFFEHTIFYTQENIKFILEKNGFEIIDIFNFNNHSLIFKTKKLKNKLNNNQIFNLSNIYHDLFWKSINEFEFFSSQCLENLKYVLSKKIFIFGASYNSQFLLYFLNKKNIKISGILDNCIEKQNLFLFGTDLKIYNPEILKIENSVVILKNGYYSKEIELQIRKINSDTLILF